MEVFNEFPDKSYKLDYANQPEAVKLGEIKWKATKLFLIVGSLLFLAGIAAIAIGIPILGTILLIIYGVALIVLFLFGIFTFPKIYCSHCKKKMKRKIIHIGGGYHTIFLICESCKVYVETRHGGGA